MHPLIAKVEAPFKKNHPAVNVGDTLRVAFKVKEGEKERVQNFEGVLIARKGAGINQTLKVRKISYGVGVERNFMLHSPQVGEITVVKKGRARRAKLYYLRDRVGKEALKVREALAG